MTQTPVDEMSFEDAMRELEKVVGDLERGDVPLNSPSRFMNGVHS